MKNLKGFTIIELVVVIAIIAILAVIILVNVTSYNVKGKDAAAIGDMATLVNAGTKYFEDKGNYYNFFSTTLNKDYLTVYNALNASNMGYTLAPYCDAGTNCSGGSTETKWCASVALKQYTPVQYFCVDSSGAKKQSTTAICISGSGVCPN